MKCPNFLTKLIFSRLISKIVNALRALANKKPDPRFIVGANPQETVHKVLLVMGFDGPPFDLKEKLAPDLEHVRFYWKENKLAVNRVTLFSNYIHYKLYSKTGGFSDSGVIGPPLPNAKELIDFINYEGVFDDD